MPIPHICAACRVAACGICATWTSPRLLLRWNASQQKLADRPGAAIASGRLLHRIENQCHLQIPTPSGAAGDGRLRLDPI